VFTEILEFFNHKQSFEILIDAIFRILAPVTKGVAGAIQLQLFKFKELHGEVRPIR
jgi:hypothetical protein